MNEEEEEEENKEMPENVIRVWFGRTDKKVPEAQGVANLIKDIQLPKNHKLKKGGGIYQNDD